MYSDERNRCSHRLGFPIRKSTDHRLIASSRGLSQLSTSFIASLRQGIHTHALSSLTIKSISNTKYSMSFFLRCFPSGGRNTTFGKLQILVVSIARQIFDCQRSDFFGTTGPKTPKINIPRDGHFRFLRLLHPRPYGWGCTRRETRTARKTWWAWIDSNYRPHPYQGCALAT